MNTREKGYSGEESAAEYLVAQGYRIVSRNYQNRYGEIDCIAEDPSGTLVFVEVKTSRGPGFGHPFFKITRSKQNRMAQVARMYLTEHGIAGRPCRFDALALYNGKVEHLKNAFLAGS